MSRELTSNYEIHEEIGRGRFGVVSRCTSCSTGESLALKSINKKALTDPLDALCLLTEPKALLHVTPHPHVTDLFAVHEDDSHLHIVTELCPGGDLHDLLASSGPLPEDQARSIFVQLMSAVSHCHENGVVHRDVKPDNILFDARGSAKLTDFGSASFDAGAGMTGVFGTPYYVAPEVLSGDEYGEKVDVWSAGVVLYVMLAGFFPFYGETAGEIFEAVLRGNLRFPTRAFYSVSPSVKDLLRRMLCRDVSRRFSADQVLRHPWVTNGGRSRAVVYQPNMISQGKHTLTVDG